MWTNHFKKYGNFIKPAAKILISGKEWSSKTVLVTNIEVSVSVGPEASTCIVDFTTTLPDFEDKKMKLDSDFAKVKLGVDIEISLGFFVERGSGLEAELEEVFVGYICDIEVNVEEGKQVILTVKGMDAKLWMMSSQTIGVKKGKTKISDVVADTVNNFIGKIRGKTIKTNGELEMLIYQIDKNDYELLCILAKIAGCSFFISVGKLYFISISELLGGRVTLTPGIGIHELKVTISVWRQLHGVIHVSLDPKDFTKKIQSKVTSSSITKYGEGKVSTSLTSNISALCTEHIIDCSISSVKEAELRSEAIYNGNAIDLVEGKFFTEGNPDARVASLLEIIGYGNPIDNTYRIKEVIHRCDMKNSKFTTEISASSSKVNPLTASLLSLF